MGPGYGVLKGTTLSVDSLVFQDNHTLLLQDNSTLIIRDKIIGIAIFKYGDVGDDIPKNQLIELPQTLNGVSYMDYREATDVNPKLIFEKCINPALLTFGPYIDVTIPTEPTIATITPDTQIYVGESITITATGGTEYLWDTGEITAELTISPIVTTAYSAIVINGGLCPTTVQMTITVVDPPTIIVNAGDDVTIFNGDSITLTANSIGTANPLYNWSTGDTTKTINVSPTTDTIYTVTISEFGNSDSDVVIVRVN